MERSSIAVGARDEAQPREADVDRLAIDTIRTLAMDGVQAAKSGHPGTPMALAPVAYTLWQQFLRYDPEDPQWPNRDRFVLSNGHASMLLYALLHLAGVKDTRGQPAVTLDDIRHFRQLGSRCPGHPEYGHTAGVEVTTGPLGQGCGNSVGMAAAGRWLAAELNRPGTTVFDYDVYAFCSDGDLMEGISAEAASLAGHLRLANLCWVYDNNRITIDGSTAIAFSEDVAQRFRAYGWNVVPVADANDTAAVAAAFTAFRRTTDRPTLIIVDSHIGFGAPHKQDTSAAHGEPLGEDEVRLAKRAYGWPDDATFLVPEAVVLHIATGFGHRGRLLHDAWKGTLAAWRRRHPDLAARFDLIVRRDLQSGWDADLPVFPPDSKGLATRDASARTLDALAPRQPGLIGGAADLVASTKASLRFAGAGDLSATSPGGRNIHFGIREHAMGAIANGLAVSGLRPFASTFLIFSDYMKPSIRLAAMMQQPVIYVFSHDSIGLGEDGPTHQPIEQLTGLRAIPGLIVLRPADANETVEAWRVVMASRSRPACLILTRQPVPTFDRSRLAPAAAVARGAYVLAEADGGRPDVILIGTGSEVSLCVAARETLAVDGIRARVVSMPSWELFDEQDEAYRDSVLPAAVGARVSVEAAGVLGWERYVGRTGAMIGMHGFGTSAPLRDVMRHFGFTAAAVVEAARRQVAAHKAA
jgi:transketolase